MEYVPIKHSLLNWYPDTHSISNMEYRFLYCASIPYKIFIVVSILYIGYAYCGTHCVKHDGCTGITIKKEEVIGPYYIGAITSTHVIYRGVTFINEICTAWVNKHLYFIMGGESIFKKWRNIYT